MNSDLTHVQMSYCRETYLDDYEALNFLQAFKTQLLNIGFLPKEQFVNKRIILGIIK